MTTEAFEGDLGIDTAAALLEEVDVLSAFERFAFVRTELWTADWVGLRRRARLLRAAGVREGDTGHLALRGFAWTSLVVASISGGWVAGGREGRLQAAGGGVKVRGPERLGRHLSSRGRASRRKHSCEVLDWFLVAVQDFVFVHIGMVPFLGRSDICTY